MKEMSMEHWWNGSDKGKLKYWETRLSQCIFVHHNPQWLAWEWPWTSVARGRWLSQPRLGPGGIL